MEAVIVGCAQIGPGFKACTKITFILMGRSLQFQVDGEVPIRYGTSRQSTALGNVVRGSQSTQLL
jgi:hypothetical protein